MCGKFDDEEVNHKTAVITDFLANVVDQSLFQTMEAVIKEREGAFLKRRRRINCKVPLDFYEELFVLYTLSLNRERLQSGPRPSTKILVIAEIANYLRRSPHTILTRIRQVIVNVSRSLIAKSIQEQLPISKLYNLQSKRAALQSVPKLNQMDQLSQIEQHHHTQQAAIYQHTQQVTIKRDCQEAITSRVKIEECIQTMEKDNLGTGQNDVKIEQQSQMAQMGNSVGLKQQLLTYEREIRRQVEERRRKDEECLQREIKLEVDLPVWKKGKWKPSKQLLASSALIKMETADGSQSLRDLPLILPDVPDHFKQRKQSVNSQSSKGVQKDDQQSNKTDSYIPNPTKISPSSKTSQIQNPTKPMSPAQQKSQILNPTKPISPSRPACTTVLQQSRKLEQLVFEQISKLKSLGIGEQLSKIDFGEIQRQLSIQGPIKQGLLGIAQEICSLRLKEAQDHHHETIPDAQMMKLHPAKQTNNIFTRVHKKELLLKEKKLACNSPRAQPKKKNKSKDRTISKQRSNAGYLRSFLLKLVPIRDETPLQPPHIKPQVKPAPSEMAVENCSSDRAVNHSRSKHMGDIEEASELGERFHVSQDSSWNDQPQPKLSLHQQPTASVSKHNHAIAQQNAKAVHYGQKSKADPQSYFHQSFQVEVDQFSNDEDTF